MCTGTRDRIRQTFLLEHKCNDVINVHDSLPPAETMYELRSQVVSRDAFIIPGVISYESQLSTSDQKHGHILMPAVNRNWGGLCPVPTQMRFNCAQKAIRLWILFWIMSFFCRFELLNWPVRHKVTPKDRAVALQKWDGFWIWKKK